MGTTPISNLRYPELTDVPNVPQDMSELATDLDNLVVPRFATSTARDAAITAPVEGQLCYVVSSSNYQQNKTLQIYTGSAWKPLYAGPYAAWKSADETLTGTTTMQDDDHLTLTLPANSSWRVEGLISYTSGATPDFQWTFTVPSGATGSYQFDRYTGGAWLGSARVSWTSTHAADGSDSTDLVILLHGILHVGTGGSFTLRWAQNGPASGNMTVHQNSFLVADQIG